jgi:hypothetical protein
MTPWIKYIEQLNSDEKLLSIYRKLRHAFQREKWTQEDLVRPPYYPRDVMAYYEQFNGAKNELTKELRMYFDIDTEDLSDYLQHKMKVIDNDTPLSDKKYDYNKEVEDGNQKRNNPRN